MHFHLGHLWQAHDRVVMKITLLHFTVNDINIAKSNAAQTISKSPFDLPLNAQGVDGETTVHYADDAINGEVAVLSNRHLDCLRDGRNIVNA